MDLTGQRVEGVVTSVSSRSVHVFLEQHGSLRCTLRGILWAEESDETRPVAVGDRVTVILDDTGEELTGAVHARGPRDNRLARLAAGTRGAAGQRNSTTRGPGGGSAGRRGEDARGATARRGARGGGRGAGTVGGRGGATQRSGPRIQVIAANIDRVIVVGALEDPPFRPGLVDRFLVAAANEGIEGMVCLNKVDLEFDTEQHTDRQVADCFRDAGLRVFETSIVTGEGIEALRAVMSQGISLVVGHSGVGKSSLLNAVSPGLKLATGDVTVHHGRGRHTTTVVTLLPLAGGGWVVDSPGIREFVLEGVSPATLARLYPGFGDLPQGCRFNDCLHRDEPDCAVRAAAEDERFDIERYDSYLRVLADLVAS